MMPPTRKHPLVDPVKHLHKAVKAHQAVKDGIAWHAKMEAAKRAKQEATDTANAGLLNPAIPPHV
jgi:hypothetical protein